MITSAGNLCEKHAQRFRIESLDSESELLAEKLADYRKGTVSEEKFRRFRLQHDIYSERFQKEFVLARIKVPSGILTSEQLLRLADQRKACQRFQDLRREGLVPAYQTKIQRRGAETN